MAKTDVLVRMKADTSGYDANIAKARKQLDQFGKDNLTAGGAIKQMTSTLLSSVGKFATFGAAIGGAMKVAKDAFNASEASVDEWGRTLEATKSVYNGFLNALNTGDISGYLGRIDEIVAAAREAYNELDRLGTMRTIQDPAKSRLESENTRIRSMLATGRYIAPVGRNDAFGFGMKTGDILSDDQKRIYESLLTQGVGNLVKLATNEVEQSARAIDAIYKKQATELGMSVEKFREGTSSMDVFERKVRGASLYREYEIANTGKRFLPGYKNPYEEYKGWDVFRVDGEAYKELVGYIKEREQQISSVYAMESQVYRTMNRVEGITPRIGGSGGSGGGSGKGGNISTGVVYPAGSVGALTQEISDLKKQQILATDTEAWKQWQHEINVLTMKVRELKGELKPETVSITDIAKAQSSDSISSWKATQDDNFKKWTESNEKYAKLPSDEEKNILSEISGMSGGVSQMVSGLNQMGIKIPQEIQSVVSVLQGITTILTAIQTINSLKFWSNGGIVHAATGMVVPGNFGYDAVPSLLTSGELVLNRAQQGVLSSALQANSIAGNVSQSGYVSGQNIFVGTNNYLKGSGQGQLVTTKMLRQYGLIN